MLKVGLTGGIGCGKTTTAYLFQQYDVPIIDADTIARDVVQIGSDGLQQLAEVFGKQSLRNDGSMNRDYFRELIFTDQTQKKRLETILHPLIFQEINQQITLLNVPYCLISIPLLFETHAVHLVQRILVVDCEETLQIQRVQQRDNLTLERIKSIMNTQVSREYRLAHADDILNNNCDNITLAQHVKTLHNFYLSLSDC